MSARTWIVSGLAVLGLPTAAAAEEAAGPAPAVETRHSFGARVGGYGFRRDAGDARSNWDECRMNGLGVFGERRFGKNLFVEGGLDFYFSESFPQQPNAGDLPIDRMSGLMTAAVGLRAGGPWRTSGYAQLGAGLELTRVTVPYDDHTISDQLALPAAFIGVGGDIRVAKGTYLGANLRAYAMGNFDYEPERLEMQPGWVAPPNADEVFDPSPDAAAQGQFYLRRDLLTGYLHGMRLCVLAVLSLMLVRTAAAECKKPSGKPLYSQKRGPLRVEPGTPAPSPTEILSVYASGAWTWVGSGDPDSGDTIPQSGCIAPAAMREVTRAVGRARFRFPRGPVATCAAVPTSRITYAAPRRGKLLSVESPCGTPPDATTSALIACVEAARQPSPPAAAELRTICRGG